MDGRNTYRGRILGLGIRRMVLNMGVQIRVGQGGGSRAPVRLPDPWCEDDEKWCLTTALLTFPFYPPSIHHNNLHGIVHDSMDLTFVIQWKNLIFLSSSLSHVTHDLCLQSTSSHLKISIVWSYNGTSPQYSHNSNLYLPPHPPTPQLDQKSGLSPPPRRPTWVYTTL